MHEHMLCPRTRRTVSHARATAQHTAPVATNVPFHWSATVHSSRQPSAKAFRVRAAPIGPCGIEYSETQAYVSRVKAYKPKHTSDQTTFSLRRSVARDPARPTNASLPRVRGRRPCPLVLRGAARINADTDLTLCSRHSANPSAHRRFRPIPLSAEAPVRT
ncbi:hypothetical protein BD413DRAFT_302128 [Trametes elegans]|nr:hypothetical protein BD413DRAFT_302128 [Trametes elegans]